jgi:hypothetical protein
MTPRRAPKSEAGKAKKKTSMKLPAVRVRPRPGRYGETWAASGSVTADKGRNSAIPITPPISAESR